MQKLLVCAVLAALAVPVGAQDKTAEDAIRKRLSEFAATWGKHDAKGLAAHWAPDGDLVNPWLRHARGRAEVEKLFADEHTTVFKSTTYAMKPAAIRFLGPDVALVDWDADIQGVTTPDGKPLPLPHHVTLVMQKKDGQWWTVSARAMVAAPPLPGTTPPAR